MDPMGLLNITLCNTQRDFPSLLFPSCPSHLGGKFEIIIYATKNSKGWKKTLHTFCFGSQGFPC